MEGGREEGRKGGRGQGKDGGERGGGGVGVEGNTDNRDRQVGTLYFRFQARIPQKRADPDPHLCKTACAASVKMRPAFSPPVWSMRSTRRASGLYDVRTGL
jgi:hypothetical protein